MAKLSGEVTIPAVELKTQTWYMAFQVIQVFLITTFASGASSVVAQIIQEPTSATTLLAENLPKASNFYIEYFILQGLGIASGDLLNIGALAMFTVVGRFLDKSPRKMFKRYITLAGLGWGSLYPKFGNLAIIGMCLAESSLTPANDNQRSPIPLSLHLFSDSPQSVSASSTSQLGTTRSTSSLITSTLKELHMTESSSNS